MLQKQLAYSERSTPVPRGASGRSNSYHEPGGALSGFIHSRGVRKEVLEEENRRQEAHDGQRSLCCR